MAAFRKVFLALVVVALAAATASAQSFSCLGSSPNASLRAEGLTELVGEIFLTCTGGPTVVGPSKEYTFTLQLNTNVTSPFLTADPNIDAAIQVITHPAETSTYHQGRRVSATQIAFTDVVIPVNAGGTTSSTILVKNVRVAGNGVAPGVSITGLLSSANETAGDVPLTINNNFATFTLGTPAVSYTSTVRPANGGDAAAATLLQCADTNKDLSGTAAKTGQLIGATIRFKESQVGAFKDAVQERGGLVGTFGAAPQPIVAGYGASNYGTRLRAVFNNVPANMILFATTRDVETVTTGFAAGTPRAVFVSGADSTGSGGSLMNAAPATGTQGAPGAFGHDAVQVAAGTRYAIERLTVSGNTAYATWEIVNGTVGNLALAEEISFGIVASYTGALPPTAGTTSVDTTLAPFAAATANVSVAAGSQANSSIPRFVGPTTANTTDIIKLTPCATNLLFPYVTNTAGFDTGLVIANTSKDPFNPGKTPQPNEQSGTCTINYYANLAAGASPGAVVSQVVTPGDQMIWTLSSGGNLGAQATPGFSGYIIAQCNFRYAHGFAFVSDLGATKLALGYLALVMDPALATNRSITAASESFGGN